MIKITKVMHLCQLMACAQECRVHLKRLSDADELGSFKKSYEGVDKILESVKDLAAIEFRTLVDPVSDREANIKRIFEEAQRRGTEANNVAGHGTGTEERPADQNEGGSGFRPILPEGERVPGDR